MANLQPITKTCEPRKDVLAGALSDEHFAADLDHIVRDPASYPVYGNAEDFFALTHPTKGLRDLLSRTFGRISGATGVAGTEKGVLRPQTSFGEARPTASSPSTTWPRANGLLASSVSSTRTSSLLSAGSLRPSATSSSPSPASRPSSATPKIRSRPSPSGVTSPPSWGPPPGRR